MPTFTVTALEHVTPLVPHGTELGYNYKIIISTIFVIIIGARDCTAESWTSN